MIDRPSGTNRFLKTLTQHFVLGYYHQVPAGLSAAIRIKQQLGSKEVKAAIRVKSFNKQHCSAENYRFSVPDIQSVGCVIL